MSTARELLQLPIFENSLLAWAAAFGITLAGIVALTALRRLARRYHAKLLATDRTEFIEVPLEVAGRTTVLFFVLLATYLGVQALAMSARTREIIDSILIIALFWQSGVWLSAAVVAWLDRKRRRSQAADRALVSSFAIIGVLAKGLIWSIVFLLTLDNLGVNITALVAGLGVGGVAVALATQNILGDLFASLSIALDKPFVVGDFLIVDDFLGSVEYIGIKSTRLRSLSGEQIVISNANLLDSRIRNYGRMAERRVIFTLSVIYETSIELLERIPAEVRRICEAQSDVRFDRSHFSAYGSHSLDFETVYYVLSADYNRHMDIQQAIYLAIYRRFSDLGVEFAYPTQKVLIALPQIGRGERQEFTLETGGQVPT